jgi:hypothetical protein
MVECAAAVDHGQHNNVLAERAPHAALCRREYPQYRFAGTI